VVSDSEHRAAEDYVHTLFERFKDAHFESRLMIAFARDFELVPVILNDQLPKGQRNFSERDVKDFIERFNKQEMNVHFLVAKNAVLSRGSSTPALEHYELALRDLLHEVSRSVGESGQSRAVSKITEDVKITQDVAQPGGGAPEPSSPQQSSQQPHEPLAPFPSFAHLVVSPLWSVIFPLPVLLGWLGEIRTRPLLGIALCTSVAFAMAHGKRGWQVWLMFSGLGNLLNLVTVLPIALWDRRGIGLPWLPCVQGMPQWVNASLWGIIGPIGCHTLCNVLLCITQKRARG